MKEHQDLKLTSGSAYRISVPLVDRRGAPQDLTGATFTYTVKDKPGGTNAFAPKTLGAGITIVASPPTVVIDVATADTVALLEHDYYHELEMVKAAAPATIFRGTVKVLKSVAGAGA